MVALAVARYAEAEYVDVAVFSTSVALTPWAMYAVVFVAVNSGVLTKSVTVWSLTLLEDGVADAAADEAESELVDEIVEASVASEVAAAANDLEAGEAEDDADAREPTA